MYPPRTLVLRSNGKITNPHAKVLVDAIALRQQKMLAQTAASRSLTDEELQKVHEYVDLMRADWDREERGLAPTLVDDDSSIEVELDSSSVGTRSSPSRTPARRKSAGTAAVGHLDTTVVSDNRRSATPRAKSEPKSTQDAKKYWAWWQQYPCVASAREGTLNDAERKFLNRMSTARTKPVRRDHHVYDWVPPVRRATPAQTGRAVGKLRTTRKPTPRGRTKKKV